MHARWIVALGLFACRPTAHGELPTPTTAEGSSTAVPADGPSAASDVVAVVDGAPISAEDLDVGLRLAGQRLDDAAARSGMLLLRIENRLLVAEAERLEIVPDAEEIDKAIDQLATQANVPRAQMQAEIEKTGVSFEAYRREVSDQIAGMKVLLRKVGPEVFAAESDAARERLVGCLRSRAKIDVKDATLSLPDNPFAAPARIGGFTFTFAGKPAIPEEELRKAADGAAKDAAAAGATLCDALERTEAILTDRYLERGHLEVSARVVWPPINTTTNTFAIRIDAGLPNVFETITFDLEYAPDPERIDTKALRKRVDALARPGDLATGARVKAVTDEVERTFRDAGFARAVYEMKRSPAKSRTRLDIIYRPR